MKKILLNHKSFLNYDEILEYKKFLEKLKIKYDIILFPSIIYLSLFKDSELKIGTQNFFSSNYGSYTGEINLESLKYLGIKYTLIGHIERHKFAFESKERTKEKLITSLNAGFNTVLCVGESKKVFNPFKEVKKQLKYYLKDIDSSKLEYFNLAYEPSWAIGGEKSLEPNKIKIIIDKIKDYFINNYDMNIEVYYGGSVNEKTIKDIIKVSDGVLIGRKSSSITITQIMLKEL